MSLNVYLFFDGNCEEAMNFYKDATGATIESLNRFGESQMPVDEAHKDKILHAIMKISDTTVMFSDSDGKKDIKMGDNFSLALDFKSDADIKKTFEALSKSGSITMPLQDTFWGATFGMCTDKFGVNWMFNYDKPKAD
jgi:PhnB protein